MKTLLACIPVVILAGCFSKEIQVEMISAELIKIDTVNRYSNIQRQLLTWRDSYNMEYVSYVPMNETYILGTRMSMLRTTR